MEEEIKCEEKSKCINKEPWLAVCLSWLIPGAGHFYLGSYLWGIILVILTVLFKVGSFFSLILKSCPIFISLAVMICSMIILPVTSSIIAFKLAKRINSIEVEPERKQDKDPWLAVFLSLILPGLGHAYLRKVGFFLLFLFIFAILYGLKVRPVYSILSLLFLRLFAAIHAYNSSPGDLQGKRKIIILFASFIILAKCWMGILVPLLADKYLIGYTTDPVGVSMYPTIRNDRVVINKIAYIGKNPEVGDIIAFKISDKVKNLLGNSYQEVNMGVKRIVAVGGETIEIKNNKVYVNNKERYFDFLQYHEQMNALSKQKDRKKEFLRDILYTGLTNLIMFQKITILL